MESECLQSSTSFRVDSRIPLLYDHSKTSMLECVVSRAVIGADLIDLFPGTPDLQEHDFATTKPQTRSIDVPRVVTSLTIRGVSHRPAIPTVDNRCPHRSSHVT